MTGGGGEVVTITSLAAGGAGVARLADGMTVFVTRAAPGDQVRLTGVRTHRRHAVAGLGELLAPGPDRIAPRCAHVSRDNCGGCQWQHLSAVAQAAAKRRIVGDALRRIGRLDVADPELVESPRAFGYRRTITLTVRRSGPRVHAGFHDADDSHRVFPLDDCAIARPELNALWVVLRDHLDGLPPGDDVRLKLRVMPAGDVHVVVSGGDRGWTGGAVLAGTAAAAGFVVTVWWEPAGGVARRVAGGAGGPADVGFAQVNPEVAERLQADVVRAAGAPLERLRDGLIDPPPRRILDLYAGAGDTAIPLAMFCPDVVLVERDGRAVRRAQEAARGTRLALRCVAGRVEDHLDQLLPADAVIVNPPRAGLSDPVSGRLARGGWRRLVYASCDPATLARDLRRLDATAAALRTLRAYDMFPQTSHVETLAVLERA